LATPGFAEGEDPCSPSADAAGKDHTYLDTGLDYLLHKVGIAAWKYAFQDEINAGGPASEDRQTKANAGILHYVQDDDP
jgi:hypothetical protein